MPRLLCLLALVALITRPAGAATIALGDADITFSPPPGYCLFDRSEPLDAEFVDVMEQALGTDTRVLAAFAECTQLSVWRKGLVSYLQDYGFLTTQRTDEAHRMPEPRRAVVATLARALARADIEAEADRVRQRSEGVTAARLGQMERLGVLHADADAVYFGLVAAVATAEGRVHDALEIGAMTLIKGRIVSYLLYGAFAGAPSVEAMLAAQRQNMARLIGTN